MEFAVNFHSKLPFSSVEEEIKFKEEEIRNKGLLYWVVEALSVHCSEGTSILDVGGGSGVNLLFYGEAVHTHKLYCLDVRQPVTSIDGITYIHGSVEELPKITIDNTEYFDCIVMTEVIEHLYDPDLAIDNILEKLRPGGLMLLTTPNLAGILNVVSLLFGFQPVDTEVSTKYPYGRPFVQTGKCVGHIRVFTERALNDMLTHHGLDIIEMKSVARTKVKSDPLSIKVISALDWLFSKISRRGGTRQIAVCRKRT